MATGFLTMLTVTARRLYLEKISIIGMLFTNRYTSSVLSLFIFSFLLS